MTARAASRVEGGVGRYEGEFDDGRDERRERTLARPIELGVVLPVTRPAPEPAAMKGCDTLAADEERAFARPMEAFAGFGEPCDAEIGRLVETLEDVGVLDAILAQGGRFDGWTPSPRRGPSVRRGGRRRGAVRRTRRGRSGVSPASP